MDKTVILVLGLFGGISLKHYEPLIKMVCSKANKYLAFRAGTDWDPVAIADAIRQIDGTKVVICISLGAIVGNLLAHEADTEIFYICPYLGAEFLNNKKIYKLRHLLKGLATFLMILARPFRNHRWYPKYGGPRPDGWLLSTYAICRQLKFAFSKVTEIATVDGTIISHGDTTVDPEAASVTSFNVVEAWKEDGEAPKHANFRYEGEEFGKKSTIMGTSEPSEDAKAYFNAFAKMLENISH